MKNYIVGRENKAAPSSLLPSYCLSVFRFHWNFTAKSAGIAESLAFKSSFFIVRSESSESLNECIILLDFIQVRLVDLRFF